MKEMNLDEIMSHIKRIALPYVKTSLEQECLNPSVIRKFKKDLKEALKHIKSDKTVPDNERRCALAFLKILADTNKKPLLPNGEEITTTTQLTASIISMAWLQFLYLALENKKEILLNEALLPQKREDANVELWEAFRGSFNSLPITPEQAEKIMRQFAKEVILPDKTVEFSNLNLVIEALQDKPRTFLVRQK